MLEAFGLVIEAGWPLPGFTAGKAGDRPGAAQLRLDLRPGDDPPDWDEAAGTVVWRTVIDGRACVLEVAATGEHRLAYGDEAVFVLEPGAATMSCWAADRQDPWWQRFLLDTGLFTASLLQGHEALHASAVGGPRGGVAFLGITGAGKTSLAIELVRRGWPLLCDDVLSLRAPDAAGMPGPPLMNVPAHVPAPGEPIAELGDERWMLVPDRVAAPVPMADLYLLDRHQGGGSPQIAASPATPLALLPHMLGFAHLAGRDRARFEVAGELAGTARTRHLTAGAEATPAQLADAVERES